MANGSTYYLKGPKEMFDPFVYYSVKVFGEIESVPKEISPYPIIAVKKIHLVR